MSNLTVYSDNVKRMTTEIRVIQDNVCQGMIEIGKRLIEIKKELGHGQWLPYIENELGYSRMTANRLIRIADEFGNSNVTSMLHFDSTKIIALLDIPIEKREDFIERHADINHMTVRQLREEIKLEFKKKLDDAELKENKLKNELKKMREMPRSTRSQDDIDRIKQLEYDLRNEKMRVKPDTKTAERNKQLEQIQRDLENKNKSLENTLKMKEQLLENYKIDSEEYRKIKLQMSKLQVEMDSQAQKTVSVLKLTELASEVEFFLHNKLAPTKYKDFMNVLNEDEVVRENFIHTIELVGSWYREMNTYIDQNNYENIITVEVN